MKLCYYKLPKVNLIMNRSIRKKIDVIEVLISFIRLINGSALNEYYCEKENANLIVCVDKMSRIVIRDTNGIHSIHLPFIISGDSHDLKACFEGENIDSLCITVISRITNELFTDGTIITKGDAVDKYFEICNEFDITDQMCDYCWRLLWHMIMAEDGYLRYDKDSSGTNLHPENHIDFFYQSQNECKIGLESPIDCESFLEIIDVKQRCWTIK